MTVTLADLEALPSFALLGPGFSGDPARFRLLEGLREATQADPLLVFAPFETDVPPATFAAERVTPCEVELVHAEAPEFVVELDARGHQEKVERIREAIAAGDVYQVCPRSAPWSGVQWKTMVAGRRSCRRSGRSSRTLSDASTPPHRARTNKCAVRRFVRDDANAGATAAMIAMPRSGIAFVSCGQSRATLAVREAGMQGRCRIA